MAHIAAHLNAKSILMVTVYRLNITTLSPVLLYCWYHFCEPDDKLD